MPPFSRPWPADALPLLAHPTEQAPNGWRLSVWLATADDMHGGGWWLRYRLEGDLVALALPAPALCGPADGLWRHTCLEAFVQEGDGPTYREFNFSPSGQWAVYRFSGERQRVQDDAAPTQGPILHTEPSAHSLTLQAWLPPALLPARTGAVGLSAVIETRDGALSHWALRHPRADRPDFHHSAGWTHHPTLPHALNHSPPA